MNSLRKKRFKKQFPQTRVITQKQLIIFITFCVVLLNLSHNMTNNRIQYVQTLF